MNPSSLHLYFHHLRPPPCLSGLRSLTHSLNGHHCNLCKMLAQSSHSSASNILRKSHFLMKDYNSVVPSSLTSQPFHHARCTWAAPKVYSTCHAPFTRCQCTWRSQAGHLPSWRLSSKTTLSAFHGLPAPPVLASFRSLIAL